MGLIDWIRSLFSSDAPERDGGDVAVTVERTPDASSEKAVKEPVEGDDTVSGSDDDPGDTAVTDADAETGETDGSEETVPADEDRDGDQGKTAADADEAETDEEPGDIETDEGAETAETMGKGGTPDDEMTGEGAMTGAGDADDDGALDEAHENEVESTNAQKSADDEDHEAETAAAGDVSPTELKGIGDAYADRLASAGVDTVTALAAADPAELAAETGISEKRIGRWIDRADDY